MKWIVRIILKDVKLGMGKERLLRLFHPDALDLLNTTNDLARVCADLADPSTHIMRKLCARASTVEEAYERLKGRPFAVEVKIDGNRLQVHKVPGSVLYYSRRGREHGDLSSFNVLETVINTQLIYVAFDILFDEEESLITRPLKERQQRLAAVIDCLPADHPGLPLGAGVRDRQQARS
eukprot:gene9828-9986_t